MSEDTVTIIALDLEALLKPKSHLSLRQYVQKFPFEVDLMLERYIWTRPKGLIFVFLADIPQRLLQHLDSNVALVTGVETYTFLCRSEKEYKLFMRVYTPMYTFSNKWRKFKCESMGAFPYEDNTVLMKLMQDSLGN